MLPTLLCALLPQAAPQAPPAPVAEKLPFSVLYAGNADSPYSAAWQAFFAAHAARVRCVTGHALQRADLDGIDLLVIDGEVTRHDKDGEIQLHDEKVQLDLDALQGRPVLLMGGQGGFVSDDLHLKTSWHAG